MFRKGISAVTLVFLIAVALGLSACAEPAGYPSANVDYGSPYGYPADWGWDGSWGGGWGHWDHAHGRAIDAGSAEDGGRTAIASGGGPAWSTTGGRWR